ncbi:hypothetical protein [Pararhodobacter sp.]|uniref:hypothetical protein n=1 Tax=Pararhodobacter sp. TaxID=2127056 RepID=UPI002FDCC3A1
MKPGFVGTWRTIESVRKICVVCQTGTGAGGFSPQPAPPPDGGAWRNRRSVRRA